MDPLAVHLAMQQAQERMRAGDGPAIVEAEVYRFFHQNGPYPGSAFGYRTKEEEAEWRARDPLDRVAREMIKLGQIDEAGVASARSQAQAAMTTAVAELLEADPENAGKRRIRPELWPDPGFVNVGVRGDASELEALTVFEPNGYEGAWTDIKFVDAVAAVMDRRMSQDSRIVVMGEDVHRLNGGTNGATKGLAKKFGDDTLGDGRVLGTPISENAFVGLGGGLALDGRYRPVVEFMYPDFMWVAADQVFNQIGKARHMFGGDNPVPLVLRTKVAMGSGYGSQHLMDPAGIFSTSPGWRIAAPSTAADYVGIMNAALALQDPVLVIEHVDLYGAADRVPDVDLDYIIPPGTAAIRRAGNDVTVISYLSMVAHSLEAIEQTGVDAELIDLRWLDRASIDWDTIGASIKKTNAVLLVEQGARGTSYGGWLADEIQRRFFDWLDQPIERVTGGEASPSISKVLERAAIARTEEVVSALEAMRRNMGGKALGVQGGGDR
jgi:2-oxoisovalerate dehydrogenase E1 component